MCDVGEGVAQTPPSPVGHMPQPPRELGGRVQGHTAHTWSCPVLAAHACDRPMLEAVPQPPAAGAQAVCTRGKKRHKATHAPATATGWAGTAGSGALRMLG